MNQLSTADLALKAELGRAIRRDQQRRGRRRKNVRLGAVSLLGVVALSSAALAAGGAFREVETVTPVAEVELPKNITIQAVDSFPEFVGRASSNGFVTRGPSARWGNYMYHVTGGEAPELGCGDHGMIPTNNIYITSTRALSEQEIELLLEPDGELVWPIHERRPPWITQATDGCPNPGVAGQPGTTDELPPVPNKAAVATPASMTPSILIRKKTLVPVAPASPAPTTTTPTPTPPTTTGASPSPTTGVTPPVTTGTTTTKPTPTPPPTSGTTPTTTVPTPPANTPTIAPPSKPTSTSSSGAATSTTTGHDGGG